MNESMIRCKDVRCCGCLQLVWTTRSDINARIAAIRALPKDQWKCPPNTIRARCMTRGCPKPHKVIFVPADQAPNVKLPTPLPVMSRLAPLRPSVKLQFMQHNVRRGRRQYKRLPYRPNPQPKGTTMSDAGDYHLPTPSTDPPLRWNRIVLKLSGEAFGGGAYGINGSVVHMLAEEIVQARMMDVDIAVVIGGGNIWRGMHGAGAGMDRAQADYMGMLATVINGLALQDTLEQLDQPTRVMTALHMEQIAEPYIRRRALRHLEKGRVIILAGGLGAPFFTTDTPAALRAAEMSAGAVVKGTHGGVDGVYTADPKFDPDATKLDEVSYMDVLNQGLGVMDPTSITFCMDNQLPIVVYDALTKGNLRRVVLGEEGVGTIVR